MRALTLVAAGLLLSACTPQEIVWHAFPGEYEKASRVVACESEWNPNAVNPTSGASGLMQIHPFWAKPGHADPVADYIGRNWHRRFDPVINAAMGQKIRQKYGWNAWVCQ